MKPLRMALIAAALLIATGAAAQTKPATGAPAFAFGGSVCWGPFTDPKGGDVFGMNGARLLFFSAKGDSAAVMAKYGLDAAHAPWDGAGKPPAGYGMVGRTVRVVEEGGELKALTVEWAGNLFSLDLVLNGASRKYIVAVKNSAGVLVAKDPMQCRSP